MGGQSGPTAGTAGERAKGGGAQEGGVVGLYAARGLARGVDLRLVAAARRTVLEGASGWPEIGVPPAPAIGRPRPLRVGRGTAGHRAGARAERVDRRPRAAGVPGRSLPTEGVSGGRSGLAGTARWGAPGARQRMTAAGLVALAALAGLAGRVLAAESADPAWTATVGGAAPAAGAQRYVVQTGDTLDGIAATFGVEPEAIAAASGLGDEPTLAPDKVVVIPPPGGLSPAAAAVDARAIPFVVDAHRVAAGETLASIAADYGLDAATLAAYNGITEPDLLPIDKRLLIPAAVGGGGAAAGGAAMAVPATAWEGTLARPPLSPAEAAAFALPAVEAGLPATRVAWVVAPVGPSAPAAVFVPGIPTHYQERNLSCEYAAAYIATAAFGAGVPESVFLAQVPAARNPHLGYRGNIDGLWGNTDDYGVYPEALAPILERYGFRAETFYAFGDAAELRRRLDAGVPVIAWLGYWGDTRERMTDEGSYSLAAGVHVVVAFGYDEAGVHVSNPANGAYEHFDWSRFEAMWRVLDGMALAVSPA